MLQEYEQMLQGLFESAPDAIVFVASDGLIARANAQAEWMFGYTREELLDKPVEVLLPRRFRELHVTYRSSYIASPGIRAMGAGGELIGLRKDGSEFPVNIMLSPLVTESGSVVIAIIQDTTEHIRALAELQRQTQRLAALRHIDRAITGGTDLRVILNVFLDQVVAQLRVDAADILLCNPNTQVLEYAAGYGFRSRAIEGSRPRLGEGHAGRAALERRTVAVEDINVADSPFVCRELVAEEGFVSYYGVPLIAKGQVNGVLEIFHRTRLDPDPSWLEFLESLGDQAAIAIDNVMLFEITQRPNRELATAYDATLEGWVRALDMRDKETERHSQRVPEITVSLARVMGMGEAELVHVRRGALLHDIGKMAVPDEILHKSGPLTEEEWAIMRRHPEHAYQFLAAIPYLRPALDIPYCHHEKWDGSGYPRGLKGEEIPFMARLFAPVDIWDALRSDRPYRAAWTDAEALEHIRSIAGTHLDPKVVEVFLPMVR